MGDVTITNPELHSEKTVDSNGRVYLGKAFRGKTVQLTVEVKDDD